ncbi:MAG: F0F1 ATP synthase subunit B [Clostridiales Family XIII bacterium]|jgi:F-type H+-transporting ATPase subunit b|nr:F0F1 ATP synthase subunit B [Clostridiales Family XIII bacterium]
MYNAAIAAEFAPLIGFNWTLVMVFITFLVLYLILKKYFFEKVRAFMLAREQKVKDSFDNADSVNRVAEEKLSEYNAKLANAENERREILKQAKQRGDETAREIIVQAEERASQLVAQAQNEIERERLHALDEMQEQVALLAIYAAEKIIEQKLDAAEQQTIIDGIIKQAGAKEWTI